MNPLLTELRDLAATYAPLLAARGVGTGLDDPDAYTKFQRECDEFETAPTYVDRLGELADLGYYLGKLLHTDQLSATAGALIIVERATAQLGLRLDAVPRLVRAKYASRAAHGRDHAREAQAIVLALAALEG
jgi:hypothetical protein